MKKKFLALATFVLTFVAVMCVTVFSASAEGNEPSVKIAKFNLAFEDNTYLKYAVRFDGVDDAKITENNIGMLYWTSYEGGFVPGTEEFSSKTTGYTTIDGVKHYVFEYTHLAAKQLTDYIYSVAYLELDGTTYYSEPVKYSALEYAYNRLGKTSEGTTDEELKALLNNMLAYGASAQQYFDYKEDRLATADFYQITLVGGTLDDGFASGLYLSTDEVTITAPETDGDMVFDHWTNNLDETVSTDNPLAVENLTANVIYTANYKEVMKYSDVLEYTSNGDGTCYVSGIGTCTDTEIVIPEVSPDGDMVTSIGDRAFYDCTSIKSIHIPNSVTSVGNRAFFNCSALTSIEIPEGVTNIEEWAFGMCYRLREVINKSSLEIVKGNETYGAVADYAYEVHSGESKIVNVNDCLFYSFEGVNYLFSYIGDDIELTLPEKYNGNTYKIDNFAFLNCSSFESVVVPEGVTSIGYYAFQNCTALNSIVIPNSVTNIGGGIFKGSSNLSTVNYNSDYFNSSNNIFDLPCITNVIFGCHQIPEDALYNCEGIREITVLESVTYIGSGAFEGCSSLERLTLPFVGEYKDGTGKTHFLHVFGEDYANSSERLPASLKSVVITGGDTLADSAFRLCTTIENILLPNTITSIGEKAFQCCSSLNSINLPEGLTTIEYATFEECGLESIIIPDSVKTIGDYSFLRCKLESITFGENSQLELIDATAFGHCENLKSIFIPKSVTTIWLRAFYNCQNLTDIYVHGDNENYKSVDGVLYTKDGKTLIAYPAGKTESEFTVCSGVNTIESYAFYACYNLEKITIPTSVKEIGGYAFYGCSSLTDVYYTGTEEEWAAISINSSNDYLTNATIHYNYVPEEQGN